jgi:hypothetical protein
MQRATTTSQEPLVVRSRIYVSFADEDRARAMALVRWLNDAGWRVEADDRHALAAPDRGSRSQRLDSCDVVLCLITPGWLISKFCHDEYAHCAKQGKFVLPVICELDDLRLLPEAMRALPRVDLTGDRIENYLSLRDALVQAGSHAESVLATAQAAARRQSRMRWLLLAAVAIAAALLASLWVAG